PDGRLLVVVHVLVVTRGERAGHDQGGGDRDGTRRELLALAQRREPERGFAAQRARRRLGPCRRRACDRSRGGEAPGAGLPLEHAEAHAPDLLAGVRAIAGLPAHEAAESERGLLLRGDVLELRRTVEPVAEPQVADVLLLAV